MSKFYNPERFPDPIAAPKDKKAKNPWNFEQPAYDQRSSCFIQAGANYGVGHRTPVGTEKTSGLASGPLRHKAERFPSQYIHKGPSGRLDTENLD